MDIKKLCLSLTVSCILFSNITNAIELKPTKKDVDEAVKFGEEHSADIFKTEPLKHAVYGNWPSSDGGFVKSKLTLISVLAAMHKRSDKKITEEDINEVLKSDELEILGNVREEVGAFPKEVYIELKQGDKIVKPKEMKPGVRMREGWTSTNAVFPYPSIDPMAKTTLILKVDSAEREYHLDFSKIR